MKVEDFFQTQPAADLEIIALIVEHDLTHRSSTAGHLVITRSDQDAGITFAEQLEDRAAGEQGQIIAVRLNGGEHFAPMRLIRVSALDEYIRLLLGLAHPCLRVGRGARAHPDAAGESSTNESSSVHADSPFQIKKRLRNKRK